MTERIGEEPKNGPALTMQRVEPRPSTPGLAGGVPNPLRDEIFKPEAFATLLKQAMYSSLESFGSAGSAESNGLSTGLFSDVTPLMLAALLSATDGGASSPTLNALLGIDPQHVPGSAQIDDQALMGDEPLAAVAAVRNPWSIAEPWSLFGPKNFGANPMPLSEFPRPAGDNGWGMHWIPTISQTKGVVDRFVGELQAMKIKWAVVLNGGTDSGRNDYLVERLTEAGIMPIMRIYTPGVQPIPPDELEALVRHYREKGVYYFQIFNEPNLRVENGGSDPDVNRYLDHWIPAARAVVRAGGLPGLGALSPGGDVDDLQFLRMAVRELKRRGQVDVLDKAWLSVHNYAGHHPIADTGDGWGFFRYRLYDDIIWDELGRHMPMIGTEGGSYPGGGFTAVDQVESVRQTYRYMAHREPYFLAHSYWMIANEEGGGHDQAFSHQALFRPDGVSPVVTALKEL
jgi:hypothetical protein